MPDEPPTPREATYCEWGWSAAAAAAAAAAVNALAADKNAKLVAMADAFADQLPLSLQRLQKANPDQVTVAPIAASADSTPTRS